MFVWRFFAAIHRQFASIGCAKSVMSQPPQRVVVSANLFRVFILQQVGFNGLHPFIIIFYGSFLMLI